MITYVWIPPFNASNDLAFDLQFLLHLLHLEPILSGGQCLSLAELLTEPPSFPAVFAVPLYTGSDAGVLLKHRLLTQTFFIFTSRPLNDCQVQEVFVKGKGSFIRLEKKGEKSELNEPLPKGGKT